MSALHDAVDAGTEGLMLKRLDVPYEVLHGLDEERPSNLKRTIWTAWATASTWL